MSQIFCQIVWENRFRNDIGLIVKVTVDGTDFPILEPTPFDSKWLSHKINGAGLRYEVCVNIQTGDIVWICGPFPPGAWPDIVTLRYRILYHLLPNEMLSADGGYCDAYQFFITPTGLNRHIDYVMTVARARHETINRRFKVWDILSNKFHHTRDMHGKVFASIANLVQLEFENGRPAFQVAFRS